MGTRIYKRGDVVLYKPFKGCDPSQYERGIVKRMADDGEHVFVLYDTAARKYETHDVDHYTCARTALSDLEPVC
jgi:hypothetical protein